MCISGYPTNTLILIEYSVIPALSCSLLQTQFVDVVLINRYYGWYEHNGHLELIHDLLAYDLEMWYEKRKKPMMISEYGAGTVIGFHVVGVLL